MSLARSFSCAPRIAPGSSFRRAIAATALAAVTSLSGCGSMRLTQRFDQIVGKGRQQIMEADVGSELVAMWQRKGGKHILRTYADRTVPERSSSGYSLSLQSSDDNPESLTIRLPSLAPGRYRCEEGEQLSIVLRADQVLYSTSAARSRWRAASCELVLQRMADGSSVEGQLSARLRSAQGEEVEITQAAVFIKHRETAVASCGASDGACLFQRAERCADVLHNETCAFVNFKLACAASYAPGCLRSGVLLAGDEQSLEAAREALERAVQLEEPRALVPLIGVLENLCRRKSFAACHQLGESLLYGQFGRIRYSANADHAKEHLCAGCRGGYSASCTLLRANGLACG